MPVTRTELVTGEHCVVVDELPLSASSSLLLIQQGEKTFICPVVTSEPLKRAKAGDFISRSLHSIASDNFHSSLQIPDLIEEELPIEAEQTNESLIVNGTLILKWQLLLSATASHFKEEVLLEQGFLHTPHSFGHITYGPDKHLVASLYQYLPNTTDGWKWCVEKAKANDATTWVRDLALVTADMHKAFAGTPYAHGDLHVGQFLNSDERFFVIDFEGNPVSNVRESALADVASLMCSFIHVGAVIDKKYPVEHNIFEWIQTVLDKFLSYYETYAEKSIHRGELREAMLEHEIIEAEYAAKFLPHWSYVADFGTHYIKGYMHG